MEIEDTVEPRLIEYQDGTELGDNEQKEDKTKMFSDSEELPDMATDKLVSKEALVEPVTLTIKRVFINRFGKPALIVSHEDEELCGQVNLNNTVYMQLKEKLGNKAQDWKNKKINLQAVEFDKDTKKGRMQGFQIKLL